MKIDSLYSKSFYSDKLSDTKLNNITRLAMSIRELKNEISENINQDLLKYLDCSKIDFQKEICLKYKDKIGSNFIKQLSDDVLIAYHNKFKGVQQKLKFEVIYNFQITKYKRKTKLHDVGDFKGISKKTKSTPLTICLTYLSRYGNENTVDYLLKKFVSEINIEKENFYANILDCIYKYGFSRLMTLALSKRKRVIQRYSEHRITFESLTFRGRSRITSDIISYNENFNSIIKGFLNISWLNRGEILSIPVKYSKDYHHNMKKYTKGTDTPYNLCFEDDGRIRVILSYKDTREIPDNKNNFVGIDVNIKHNLFQCSTNDFIDYDRNLVDVLSKELLKIDELKKNKKYEIGKKRQRKINHLQRELNNKIKNSISDLCKHFNKMGVDHAVFEDLNNGFGKCFVKDENDLNFNRKVKMLGLSSLKDEFEHIANNYDICTSTTNPAYTSQTCSECGCIDSENRKNQEEFECIECGFKTNADKNASLNILERIISTVIRERLHNKRKIGNGTYEPKSLKREKVKEVLLSLRSNLVIDKESEFVLNV